MPSNQANKPNLKRQQAGALRIVALALLSGCASEPAPFESAPERVPARALLDAPAPIDDDACGGGPPSDGDVLKLDNGAPILFSVGQSADRIVASDANSWMLWDRPSGKRIARGSMSRLWVDVDLAGDTLLTPAVSGFELRDASDGALRTTVSYGPGSRLTDAAFATDGSYVYAIYMDGVRLWDLRGNVHFRHASANLSATRVRAGRDVLRLAPSDTKRVETVTIASGEARMSAGEYAGDFHGWFLDGSHFVTMVSDGRPDTILVHVYTPDATLVQTFPWSSVTGSGPPRSGVAGGDGEHVWVQSVEGSRWTKVVRIYRLGQSAPVLTLNSAPIDVARTVMPVFVDTDSATLLAVDLRGASPIVINRAYGGGWPSHGSADADGRLAFTSEGVLYDDTRRDARGHPRRLGCGELRGLATAPGRLAVATSDRTTRIYALATGTPVLTAKIDDVQGRSVSFSADGRLLFLQGLKDGAPSPMANALYAYELDAEGRPLRSFQAGGSTVAPFPLVTYSVSADGARVARSDCVYGSGGIAHCAAYVFEGDRQLLTLPSSVSSITLLSPSGRHVAAAGSGAAWTNLYEDFELKTRLEATAPLLWLDDDRLLVARPPETGAVIVDRRGNTLARIEGALEGAVKLAGSQRMHDGESVYSTVDGKLLWNLRRDAGRIRDKYTVSALVDDQFVFVQDHTIRLEPVRVHTEKSPGEPVADVSHE